MCVCVCVHTRAPFINRKGAPVAGRDGREPSAGQGQQGSLLGGRRQWPDLKGKGKLKMQPPSFPVVQNQQSFLLPTCG